mmetsp:Transcript_91572/g.167957  ORF Transcript_91572/g.167957 Transcript_91572/m.167957 type:complete len:85 (-) Transcript_91572:66-320(-)
MVKGMAGVHQCSFVHPAISQVGWWAILAESRPEEMAHVEAVLGEVKRVEFTQSLVEAPDSMSTYCTVEAKMAGHSFKLRYGWSN